MSTLTPPHAFPTTYPPPHRPPSGLPSVEWLRTTSTSPCSPSTSTIDMDSLCLRFTKSLVIDENQQQSPPSKASIFSLPAVCKKICRAGHPRPKFSKREPPKMHDSRKLPTFDSASTVSPLKVSKPRQLSVPPSFPASSARARLTSRKTSTPARAFAPKRAPASPKSSDSGRHIVPTISPFLRDIHTTSDLDTFPCLSPGAPVCLHSPPDSMLDRDSYIRQGLSSPMTGLTTPTTLLPNLLPEPTVVPSTPVHLSLGFSLLPITDPFTQFQSHGDYFSNTSPFDYDGFAPGHITGGHPSKNPFDTLLGPDHLSHCILTPVTSKTFEMNCLNTYAVF